MLEQSGEVGHANILRVLGRILRCLGYSEAAHVIGDDTARGRKIPDLWIPGAQAATEAMDPDERRAAAGFLVVELDTVDGSDRHGRP
jgi:hypothetical protein